MSITWNQIFDASMVELDDLLNKVDLSFPQAIYIQVLLCYLKGDLKGLEELWSSHHSSLMDSNLLTLMDLRLKIRKRDYDPTLLFEFESRAVNMSSEWKGELFFSLGVAWAGLNNHEKALSSFYNSFTFYMEQQIKRKALKAYLNTISAYENTHPNHLTLANFWYFINLASETKGHENLGMAYLNLSYQFQKIGSLKNALNQGEAALLLLSSDKGSIQYYLAKCQLIELYMSRGEDFESQKISSLYNEILESSHPEILEISKYLSHRYRKHGVKPQGQIDREKVPPAWKSRIKDYSYGKAKFSEQEESLILFLSSGAKTIDEIVQNLYHAESGSSDQLAARVRSQIHRINLKKSELIKKHKKNHFGLANNKIFDEIVIKEKYISML